MSENQDPRRRHTDGTFLGIIQGWPWKLQFLAVILGWFGPMAVITLFFMAIWAGWIQSPITENTRHILRVEGTLVNAVTAMQNRVSKSDSQDAAMLHLQLQTCRNTAKTESQIAKCDDFWRAR